MSTTTTLADTNSDAASSPGGIAITRQYTVRRGPLAQNPFTDPGDEDWVLQKQAEAHVSELRPSLRITNPDASQINLGDSSAECVIDDKAQTDGQVPLQEHIEGNEQEVRDQVVEDPELELPTQSPSSESASSKPPSTISTTTEDVSLISKSTKRVSFASNS